MKLTAKSFAFLFLSAVFWSASAYAQGKMTTLNGTLTVTTGESFPYKIELKDSGDYVVGYSYTYAPPQETKATIKGRIDKRYRTLKFKEQEIVYSNGYRTKAFMCLVNAHLELVQGGPKGKFLAGSITSVEADKTACTPGTIVFDKESELEGLFTVREQFDTVISMKKRVRDAAPPVAAAPAPAAQPAATEKITAGVEKSYDWYTDTVIIEAWDGGNIDGDRITIDYNGKPLITNYYLIKDKRTLRVAVTPGKTDILTITADNEGSDPPNTASLMLTDGNRKYSVIAYNTKGGKAIVKIKKAQQ